jgi:hypothetical protein
VAALNRRFKNTVLVILTQIKALNFPLNYYQTRKIKQGSG